MSISIKDGCSSTTKKTPRGEVYAALNAERAYQQRKWGESPNQVSAFILYMEHNLAEARKLASTTSEETNKKAILDCVRKVTALGVACMEQHGAPKRADPRPTFEEVKDAYRKNRDRILAALWTREPQVTISWSRLSPPNFHPGAVNFLDECVQMHALTFRRHIMRDPDPIHRHAYTERSSILCEGYIAPLEVIR